MFRDGSVLYINQEMKGLNRAQKRNKTSLFNPNVPSKTAEDISLFLIFLFRENKNSGPSCSKLNKVVGLSYVTLKFLH